MTLALHVHGLGLVRYPPDAGGDPGVPPGFIVELPSTPDFAVAFQPRPGFPPDDDSGYELAEEKIIVRTPADAGYLVGHDLAKSIRDSLNGTGETTWASGTEYETPIAWCNANEDKPVWLGRDEQDRPRWSVSIQTLALITEV